MLAQRFDLETYPPFAGLPAETVTLGHADDHLRVHLRGQFDGARLPIVCIPGYFRNMSDFASFADLAARTIHNDWPMVLPDLKGRGRSPYRARSEDYSTVSDATDIALLMDALAIERAVFLGQGHGGHVAMNLGINHHRFLAGLILLDSGPTQDAAGLTRVRDNYLRIAQTRGKHEFETLSREISARSYPGATETELDALVARTHTMLRRRAKTLFDQKLLQKLEDVRLDDVFEAQWPLMSALHDVPLMLMRTQLTDQLQRTTYEHMSEIRPDARTFTIAGQGSPALLAEPDCVSAIMDFVQTCNQTAGPNPIVAG
ncbi:MAG: alpha/beta hydrolase [Hyphomicrobiaceae bacterium]|nr:alpha/beta hydrolase [Hyphomicrobiaceae bacterium]MCC0024460.1 alpha/beta hydrolase [Hyphomicrobiaceae bacterium]